MWFFVVGHTDSQSQRLDHLSQDALCACRLYRPKGSPEPRARIENLLRSAVYLDQAYLRRKTSSDELPGSSSRVSQPEFQESTHSYVPCRAQIDHLYWSILTAFPLDRRLYMTGKTRLVHWRLGRTVLSGSNYRKFAITFDLGRSTARASSNWAADPQKRCFKDHEVQAWDVRIVDCHCDVSGKWKKRGLAKLCAMVLHVFYGC